MCWVLVVYGVIGGRNLPAYCVLMCWWSVCCGLRLGQGCEYVLSVWSVWSVSVSVSVPDRGIDVRDLW